MKTRKVNQMLKLLGKLGMLLILLWGMDQAAGLAAFVDSISVLIVLGGVLRTH